jgi:cell division protein ZapA
MGQVAVTVNGRTYRLRCGEGEEERLMALAAHVRSRLETLVAEFGQAGDERLMLVAALLVTDELFDARDRIRQLEIELEAAATDAGTAAAKPGKSKAGAA